MQVYSFEGIDRLAKFITLNRTPIVIVDKLSYGPDDSKEKAKGAILDFLSQWSGAIEKGPYHEYLKFYDHEYLPDIAWWSDWNKIRKSFGNSNRPFSVDIKRTSILKHKDVYVVLFDLFLKSSDRDVPAGTKKFYLTLQSNQPRVIGEEFQDVPKNYKKGNPLVFAYRNLKSKVEGDRGIPEFLNSWLEAWSSKDINRYAGCYSRGYVSQGGASLKSWLKHKRSLNRKYDYIRVSRDNLVVNKGKKKSTVSFVQIYESSGYKAVGKKRLVLIKEEGRWKIYRETWQKI